MKTVIGLKMACVWFFFHIQIQNFPTFKLRCYTYQCIRANQKTGRHWKKCLKYNLVIVGIFCTNTTNYVIIKALSSKHKPIISISRSMTNCVNILLLCILLIKSIIESFHVWILKWFSFS